MVQYHILKAGLAHESFFCYYYVELAIIIAQQ